MGLLGSAFVVGGVATAGLGIAVAAMPHAHPFLSQAAWVLGRLGLSGPAMLAPGAALVAGGALVLSIRSLSRLIGVDRESAEAIDDLTRATTHQAGAINVLESQVAALRQESAEAGVLLRDQLTRQQQRDENDPLFRLAASLDQLGARMERSVQSAREQILDAVHALHDHVEGAPSFDSTPIVDSAVRVERCMDDLVGRLGAIERELADALRPMAAAPEPSNRWESEAHAEREASCAYEDAEYAVGPQDEGHGLRMAPAAELEQEYAAAAFERNAAWAQEPAPWSAEEDEPLRLRLEPLPPLPAPRSQAPDMDEVPELAIEDELDRAFVAASDDEVPAPLPTRRPEGLDLLTRLDSARPLDVAARDTAPPLFPDLDWDRA